MTQLTTVVSLFSSFQPSDLASESHARFVGEVVNLIAGTVFIVTAIVALVVAAIRRHAGGVRVVFLLGIWSATYGIQQIDACDFFVALLPDWLQLCLPYLHALITYLTLPIAALTFRQLAVGKLRQFVTLQALTALGIAALGVGRFILTGDENWLLGLNNLVAAIGSIVLVVVFMLPNLSRRYLIVQDRRVMLAGTVIFGAEALLTNLLHPLGYRTDTIWDDVGFAVFLLSIGYVAMQQMHASERRLSSLENELAIARQLQFSILPTTTPDIRNLRIAAVYEPMSAVAGDFYEYLPVDDFRAGFLVADVSGHGVPAALIASMIKVAAQTVVSDAANPSQVLRSLEGILCGQLRGQFVSAAYLWVDTEKHVARYSAAGHPPLLVWCAGCAQMNRLESNGPLFGTPCAPEFPTREIPFNRGDRFLIYTDGLSEPENASGEAFGDHHIEHVLRENQSRPTSELSLLLLNDVRSWSPAPIPQQDDITLLVIDVL